MSKINPKNLLIIDFSCAFVGALLYFCLLDFLNETFLFPVRLLEIQMMLNLVYGFFGLFLFFKKQNDMKMLRFLMCMNALYSFACLVMALFSGFNGLGAVAMILLLEAVLILTLVSVERKIWI